MIITEKGKVFAEVLKGLQDKDNVSKYFKIPEDKKVLYEVVCGVAEIREFAFNGYTMYAQDIYIDYQDKERKNERTIKYDIIKGAFDIGATAIGWQTLSKEEAKKLLQREIKRIIKNLEEANAYSKDQILKTEKEIKRLKGEMK